MPITILGKYRGPRPSSLPRKRTKASENLDSIRKKTKDELFKFTKAGLKKLEEDYSQTKMFASIRSLPSVAKLLSKV